MEKKNQKLLIIVGVLLLFGGVSLAYFVSRVLTNGNGGNTSVTTAIINGATLNVEGVLSFEDLDILPGHKSVSSIKVTATGNNELIPYNLIWQGTNTLTTPLNFTIYKTSEELSVTSTCTKKTQIISGAQALSEECEITNIDKLGNEIASGTINKNETKVTLVKDEFVTAVNNGISYYYYIILEYPNLDEPQNEDLNGLFEGKVTVEESNIKPDINILAAYIEADGSYKQVDDIPQEGYQLNIEKSTCSNGTIPNWNTKTHTFSTSNLTKSGTSCYLYFDKYVITTKSIIASFGEAGGIGFRLKNETPTFRKIATGMEVEDNNGIYIADDPMYGTDAKTYYWRGAVTTNYVKFANFCWRAIRINGDGSIRLIYDGNTCHKNGEETIDSVAISGVAYNTNNSYSNYVGWTYTGVKQRTLEGTPSNAKTQLESWYSNNLNSYDTFIADGKFCNDRNVEAGTTWDIRPNYTFYYAAKKRLFTDYVPSLECDNEDIYILKVGLITADEVEMAGGKYENNTSYYLYNGRQYWTMTPNKWYNGSSNKWGGVFNVDNYGMLYDSYDVSWTGFGLRPVINLRSDVTFSGGDGTIDNPYVVAD